MPIVLSSKIASAVIHVNWAHHCQLINTGHNRKFANSVISYGFYMPPFSTCNLLHGICCNHGDYIFLVYSVPTKRLLVNIIWRKAATPPRSVIYYRGYALISTMMCSENYSIYTGEKSSLLSRNQACVQWTTNQVPQLFGIFSAS